MVYLVNYILGLSICQSPSRCRAYAAPPHPGRAAAARHWRGRADVPRHNYGAARASTEHLLQHGRQRIAYIAGSDHTPDNAERLAGLRDALAAIGLHLPPERLARGDYLRGSRYRAMEALLDLAESPDAVFAANDQIASDALIAIRERGLRTPEDIALVGFDDVPLANYVIPPLMTAHQPIDELGRQAALAVLAALGGAPLAARVVLPAPIVIRRSCGCSS